jgi:hypothetical protein
MLKSKYKEKIPSGILIGIKQKNKRKVFCKRGHILTSNPRRKNTRYCRICLLASEREFARKNRIKKQLIEQENPKSKFDFFNV